MASPHSDAVATDTAPTPEVQPLTSLLAHPLLQDPKFVAAAGGLVVLFLLVSVLRPGKKAARRNGPATVLLVGPSDSGKTSLFAKLVHGIYPQTHTSVVPSITAFPLPSPYEDGTTKNLRLIDLPGHPRLRDQLERYVKEASAVVFVVDVQAVVRNAASVAEELPPVLSALSNLAVRLPPSSPPPKLLILAHKADLLARPAPSTTHSPPEIPETTLATATERLKSILTREMDRLKSSRESSGGKIEGMSRVSGSSSSGFFGRLFGFGSGSGAAIGGSGGDDDEDDVDEGLVWGGKGPFTWEDVEGVEIEWAASGLGVPASGKNGEATEEGNGLDEVKRFVWEV
ncbi:signal recognition particle receptor subunit beta [Kwoniella heveanensis CBS 569]|uniref:Signal recognition particle receptor subunit beta n=1 Tax=Kwoniella heveanensis BCC8398 TaxID=1296120 RepID=A0A1B9GW64_9TREE|nr:signal recognition particle receptor subunit beta [Kwoniella heveanensis BCC8398]OCF44684.1 signal recognition particle receptor subunit beta [Kwoniella heveanensis CBS 569]